MTMLEERRSVAPGAIPGAFFRVQEQTMMGDGVSLYEVALLGFAVQVTTPLRGWVGQRRVGRPGGPQVVFDLQGAQVFPDLVHAGAVLAALRVHGSQGRVVELLRWRNMRLYRQVGAPVVAQRCGYSDTAPLSHT